jgi:hypothetical protein
VSHIESYQDVDEVGTVFNMAELKRLYCSRLQELGIKDPYVHTTRLKNRILAAVPNLTSHTEGRDVLLAFDHDIGAALKLACSQDHDSEALIQARTAKLIRHDIFTAKQTFTGHFSDKCQEESVPNSLLT